jgi:hypothetical protein
MPRLSLLLLISFALSCSNDNPVKLSGEGESCQKAGDCQGSLRCIQQVCVKPSADARAFDSGALDLGVLDGRPVDQSTLLPCPQDGIGKHQMAKAHEYNCTTPQLCIDVDFCQMEGRPVDKSIAPWSCNVVVTNCSRGNNKLTLSSLQLLGDPRCHFSEPQLSNRELLPGASAVLKVDYDPETVGEDHASLIIKSNAANFATFNVLICGFAVVPRFDMSIPPDPLDAGIPPADAGGTRCKAATTLNTRCHQ